MEKHAGTQKNVSHPPLYATAKYSDAEHLKFPLFLMNFYIITSCPPPKKKNRNY